MNPSVAAILGGKTVAIVIDEKVASSIPNLPSSNLFVITDTAVTSSISMNAVKYCLKNTAGIAIRISMPNCTLLGRGTS